MVRAQRRLHSTQNNGTKQQHKVVGTKMQLTIVYPDKEILRLYNYDNTVTCNPAYPARYVTHWDCS